VGACAASDHDALDAVSQIERIVTGSSMLAMPRLVLPVNSLATCVAPLRAAEHGREFYL
jgi:hypothetical protein